MLKRWIRKPAPDPQHVRDLAAALRVNEAVIALLCQRGICTFDEAKAYFRPAVDTLHDPLLMRDMDRAVQRLTEALFQEEKVLVYGDYDVDGTTSVALVYSYLRPLFGPARIDYYIPDRYTEGYGISTQGIDWAADNGFKLIVALDCGVKSVDKVAYANERGVDFIICDHHLPGAELPAAVAVLDPKRADCAYPFKELSGCGVGFKLMQALCQAQGFDEAPLHELMDLLAVSIAADIVPITGENRTLVYHGLKRLNDRTRSPRAGFDALRQLAGLREGPLTVSSLVFGFAPRINAAGRLGDAKRAVSMLLAESAEEALAKANVVDKTNTERRGFDTRITEEALQMLEADQMLRNARATVLFKQDWHKGVIGIVASRCLDKYYRPTVILTESNGKATGSARSVVGFDVHQAIVECADLLDQYGGHMYAAGLTMPLENVKAFRERFEQVVAARLTDEQTIPPVEIDLPLRLEDISWSFYNLLHQMEPFGPGNTNPVFESTDVRIVPGSAKVVGNSHLKLTLTQEGSGNVEAIGFGLADHYDRITRGQHFSVCYTVDVNEYRGQKTLQLRLKDIGWN
ncbi:single-stranded-DNA-specific exonuclease RecJ [Hymenobacter busanensis]|uniref:Single-stranded-DNA-specific exonuclease RecJ n=1 Tax=Hymenobacter busanensis TaxID=2607656 RepID=A0A7L4ZZC8_9BACT|nr:single-stranded-DNA-specific exonuclease RecJ [Hymenobacter busanensis]KAA9332929.1 single-stranded-DNA-specific exonuclease RecJ [Hymenobacter busanensis]QHJ08397.1 single-stranded-DNA-specific exonuclease RecJ [Hymenobacter busanensis]